MAKDHKDDEEKKKLSVSREELNEALKIFKYIRPYRWHFILGLVLLFLSSMTFMGLLTLPGQMVDVAQGKSTWGLTLAQLGFLLLGILVIQGFVSFFRVTLFAVVSENGVADIRKDVFAKVISLPISFFEQNRVGELVSRLTSDVERLYSTFSITLAEFIRQILLLVTGIIFIAIFTPKLAGVMLLTFPLIVVGAMFFGRFIRKLSKRRQKALAESNIVLSETTQSVNAVKAYTNEWLEISRYGQTLNKVVDISLTFAKYRAGFAVFIVSVLFGALFFIIWQGALMVQDGTMTAGDLISFVSYTAVIGGAIAGLGSLYTEILGAIGATERIREILGDEGEVDVFNDEKLPPISLKGDIEYKNIQFRYPTREDILVLKGLNFKVKAGQKVALVGPSGAGKSTIVQLLLRFYEAQEGEILVDGKALNEYNVTQFRRNVAIVPQEVLLFGGTIEENIAYGRPDGTKEEIREAARQANALEFIDKFPEQMQTLVGERGIKLSGGQRQRIAIARAILRDPAILLLDEATSSLDAESERVVQEALDNLMKGRTSIIIAHRLATVREVDQIFVIDDGVIAEQGTHEELSKVDEGIYSSLAKLQFEYN